VSHFFRGLIFLVSRCLVSRASRHTHKTSTREVEAVSRILSFRPVWATIVRPCLKTNKKHLVNWIWISHQKIDMRR
jgi:hypothetical protein